MGAGMGWDGERVQRRFEDRTAERAEAAVEVVADLARAGAPVETGELRDSIEGSRNRARVVATAPHAAAVEFGTVEHAPNPFLRAAQAEAAGRGTRLFGEP